MDAFTTLIGRYNSTLLTLADGQRSTIALDEKSRVILDHTTSSSKIGDGTNILDMLVQDVANAGDEVGLGLMTVRQDTLSSLVSADGDYSMLSVDANGALYTRLQSEKAEDSAHSSGDFGLGALFVRQDTAGTMVSADGDYTFGQTDSEGWIRVVSKGMKAEDSAHSSGDIGMPFLGVRNDTEGSLVDADGDYTMAQFDALGRLRTTAEIDLTPGTEADIGVDAAGDGEIDVDDTWNDIATIALTSGTLLVTAIDASADKLIAVRLVTDVSGTPTVYHRKFLVTENNGTMQLVFPRPIEIAGAANTSVILQAKKLRQGSGDAHVAGGINGYTL